MSGFTTDNLPLAIPPLTGNELFAADTQLGQGLPPQSEAISTSQLANYTFTGGGGVLKTNFGGTGSTTIAGIISKPLGLGKSVTQNIIAASNSTSTNTSITYRTGKYFPQYTRNIRLVYGNFGYTSLLVQTPPGNSITVEGALEYNGHTVQATFNNGQDISTTISNGGVAVSDPIGIDVPSGQEAFVRTYVSQSGNYNLFFYGGQSDTFTNGSNVVTGTGSLSSGGTGAFNYGPIGVLGDTWPNDSRAFYLAGDSLLFGTNDQYPNQGPLGQLGHITRGLGVLNPPIMNSWVQTGVGSTNTAERLAQYNTTAMILAMDWCDYAIYEGGTNDLANSVATIQANYIAYWTVLVNHGLKVYQTTLQPSSVTSTDGFNSTTNQTKSVNDATRVTINNWIRTIPFPLSGYIEVANTIEANILNVPTQNGGYWYCPYAGIQYVNSTATTNGTNTLTDSTQSWTTNQWFGYTIYIVSGTGAGGTAIIWANNTTVLTLGAALTIDNTSVYNIRKAPTIDGTHGSPVSYPIMAVPVANLVNSLPAY